jgi:hypothetical protein
MPAALAKNGSALLVLDPEFAHYFKFHIYEESSIYNPEQTMTTRENKGSTDKHIHRVTF